MASKKEKPGRTNPPGNDESSDEEDTTFHPSAPGDFRGKVTKYPTAALEYPAPPAYNVGEEVFLLIPGQAQPAGPYEVMQSLEGKRYRIKAKGTGQEHHSLVRESDLVYKVQT
ncbi:uncharacterized protein yc1106_07707 [Curvularia clavata]|uniref:Uncharacterized protein n=1 Tax=Curvularia clavata TaxID=95742 RepID=A0A9Q8ZHX5_CURCL|nr:uncharacterized protein yc1106_07707 [Curvularia clavata]